MNSKILPLFAATGLIEGNKGTFRTIEKKVTIEAPAKLLRQLYKLCDGKNSLGEIISSLESAWERNSLVGLLEKLIMEKVLIDCRDLQNSTWRAVQNPQPFPQLVTDEEVSLLIEEAQLYHKTGVGRCEHSATMNSFSNLLLKRRSVRAFDREPIDIQALINILWCAYGQVDTTFDESETKFRRTVPSAGALYPLNVHVAIFYDMDTVSKGIYRVIYGKDQTIGLDLVSTDPLRLVRSFINPLMMESASGAVIVSGSIEKSGLKYGNRALLYVPLEAGHVAQNISLAAQVESVSTVEIGGFVDELLADSIQLGEKYQPLTVVAFGHEAKETRLEKNDSEIQWVIPMAGNYKPGFTIAQAKAKSEFLDDWSYGRDASPSLAKVKALAEAKEWVSAGFVHENLVKARYSELTTAIDPLSILKFDPAQFRMKGFPFRPFDETAEYEWVEGRYYQTGNVAHILGDQVYFPFWTEQNTLYGFANSSGCAAHISDQLAIETGTLELIERDAFMNSHLAKLQRPIVLFSSLSSELQSRIMDLQAIGFEVYIIDQSLDLAPVSFVYAKNSKLGFMTCASSASFDSEEAVSHALMEVEASVLARLQNGPTKELKYSDVGSPADHGALYDQKDYFEKADFMIGGKEMIRMNEIGKGLAKSWDQLMQTFTEKNLDLLTVSLVVPEDCGGNGDLSIYRCLIPGLVPMTFGYLQVPGGMPRIYDIAERFGNIRMSFQDIDMFPHPFA